MTFTAERGRDHFKDYVMSGLTYSAPRSEREKKLKMPERVIKRAHFVGRGFNGDQLRKMRKRNGVGRPIEVTLQHAPKGY